MKATILQANFAKALSQVSRIVGARSTLPVLSNILISAKKGKITLSATDLEIGIRTTTLGKIDEDGELTIPARLLSDFILNNHDETILLETDGTKIKLKSDHFEANISGISAEEFPTVPETPGEAFCSIKRDDFIDAVKKVIIASANDETRPVLAGVYFQFNEGELTLAATDSYRLAEKKIRLRTPVAEKKLIVPSRTMAEVLRLAGGLGSEDEVTIAPTENQVCFVLGETLVVSRVIEGAFPPYAQIIPSSSKVRINLNFSDFLSAVKMAALFAKDAANNIKVTVGDKELTIASALAQSGDAKARIAAEVAGSEMSISFNARYVLDVLGVISGDKVVLKFNDGASSGLIESVKDKNYLYIVMPLRME